jgi:hypothetical protein
MTTPVVPLSAFSNLAGSTMADDLRRLIAHPGYLGLVLFSDTVGESLALLPIGPGERYGSLDEVDGIEIEGLRPLCALRLRGSSVNIESEDGVDQIGRKQTQKAHEINNESEFKAREKLLVEAMQLLTAREQALSEREAQLDHREQQILNKEREFFRQSADLPRAPMIKASSGRSSLEA